MNLNVDPRHDPRNLIDKYKGWSNEDVAADLAKNAFPLHIAIENYQHDFNIGTIVRNANAFNVAGVHIVGKRKWNRRGAMVTDKYLRIFNHESPADLATYAANNELELVGIDNTPGSIYLHETTVPKSVLFVFGQEGPGLSDDMQRLVTKVVAIPQFGSTRSVNVGVASGIVLYEWVRRHVLESS